MLAAKKGRKRGRARKRAPKKPAMDPMAMMKDMSPEELMGMMREMMPKMSENCSEFMGMMHETMPKVMGDCFAKMDPEERASMISMCRSMLDRFEKQA